MSLTRVAPSLIAVANNVTSNVFGSANTIPSFTFDASGVISTASNTAIQINTADIVNGAVSDAKIAAVANTKITGNIISSQITSVANTQITGNIISSQITSVANTQLTGVLTGSQLPAGSVLQVVSTSVTSTFTSSGSEATVLTQAITPSSSSSRILVFANSTYLDNKAAGRDIQIRFKRNSTVLNIDGSVYTYYMYQANGQTQVPFTGTYLDSPATTSSITYGIFIFSSVTVSMSGCQLILMEIAG